ncbi:MAG: ribonuclease P protein component [Lachnospiraceae bacterium]|nr:ribonuclease P protein component [Lachnospiraceae bacterium]
MVSLKNTGQFDPVYREGKAKADRYLVMYVLKNNLQSNRLGISVSKKVGNSVVRHRLARLVRETMRLRGEMFNRGLDIVVVIRASANPRNISGKPLKQKDIEKSVLFLAKKHNVLKK